MCQHHSHVSRGRPPLYSDETILDAALKAFAEAGYDAMSVRALNAQLGLSHEAVSQRFGSKHELYLAATRHGLELFLAELAEAIGDHPTDADDLVVVRATVRGLMVTAARRPAIGRLLDHEATRGSDRLDFIVTVGFEARMVELAGRLQRLVHAGTIRPTTIRGLFFLAEGGAAAFNRTALSDAFDPIDGPLQPDAHIEWATEVITRGLLAD